MDAFFAAVEERDKPWLKGLPVVVGADPQGGKGRGVVATANYAARKYGIHSALPITKAWKYSEDARKRGEKQAVFISGRSGRYGEVSREVFSIVEQYVKTIQVTSIDEGYLDFSFLRSYKKAKSVAEQIKREIRKKLKLTCSIGIGPNKMIAKIASDHNKPDGLTVVKEKDILDFLGPLSVGKIPGVGPKMQASLLREGVRTISDARKFSWEELYRMYGEHGLSLFQKLYGNGSTSLENRGPRKSIGQHETFREDTRDREYVYGVLQRMTADIMNGLVRKGFRGFRTLVLTVRFSDFETKNRSLTGDGVVSSADVCMARALKLLLPFFELKENPQKKAIRMVGLRVENLV